MLHVRIISTIGQIKCLQLPHAIIVVSWRPEENDITDFKWAIADLTVQKSVRFRHITQPCVTWFFKDLIVCRTVIIDDATDSVAPA